jgi:hypothetical protein
MLRLRDAGGNIGRSGGAMARRQVRGTAAGLTIHSAAPFKILRHIEARQEAGVASYRQALEHHPDLRDRVGALARLRTAEGYMAEFEMQNDGSFLLIENHCSIRCCRSPLPGHARRPHCQI